MRKAWCLALGLAVAAATLLGSSPATAESLTLTWDSPTYSTQVGQPTVIGGRIAGLAAEAQPPSQVVVERQDRDLWEAVATELDGAGFTATVPGETATYRARVVVDGEEYSAGTTTVEVRAADSELSLSMRSSAVDYTKVPVVVRWTRTYDNLNLSGPVRLEFRRKGTKTWEKYKTVAVADGSARIVIKPRLDGAFRVRWVGSTDVAPRASAKRGFNNKPPGKVVVLPSKAPKPTITLGKQPRAARVAADPKVTKISAAVWKSMKGRSWHKGCPVGRSKLRMVSVSYWAFDGYVRRGEIVVHKSVAKRTSKVFADLFKIRTPIRSMYRVDRFGWSKKLRGANDFRSMKADNTSGFNCRQTVGRTGSRSPHSTGKSIDINPWENPYRVGRSHWPNKSWASRSKPERITWRGSSDPVVKVFRKHGFRWLGASDRHHFQD